MKEEKTSRLRFPWWWKTTIFISILCLTIFSFASFGYWEKLTKKVKIEQTFKEGEELSYKISKTMTTMMEGFKTDTSHITTLSLKIPRVSKEGIMDLVIRKESGTTKIGNQSLPDPNIGKQVKIRLRPNGQLESMEGDIIQVEWPELILQNIPDKKLKIGDSWTFSRPAPKEMAGMKGVELRYTVVGFEKVKGYDCVKVGIESLMEMEDYKVKKPATMPEGINLPAGLTIPEEITMSLYLKTDGTAFLAYRKGYIIVKSTTKSKMITKLESTRMTVDTKSTVELL